MTAPVTDRDRERTRIAMVVLFFVALVPRLWAARALTGEAVWDGHYYEFGAKRIAQGLGYSDDIMVGGASVWHPWCHYPVGYSGALGAVMKIFGTGTWVAPTFGAFIGAALAVVVFGLARAAGLSERRSWIAGGLVALHPGLVLYSALVMTEPLAALLTLSAFWIFAADRERRANFVVACLVLGLATLVRPQALLCAPVLGWLYARESLPRRALFSLAATALTLLPVLPWTIRNCRVMDGCALVSTNAGWNLAIGAFPRATGRFETLRSSDGCREVTGQVQQDRCWREYGMHEIAAHPAFWLGLMPKKLSYTFDHESFAVEYLHEARPEDWPEPRRAFWRDLLTSVHRLLVCASALAGIAFVRRGRGAVAQGALLAIAGVLVYLAVFDASARFWPLCVYAGLVPLAVAMLHVRGSPSTPPALLLPVVLLLTTAATHAIFFGEDRYHIVVSPTLCLLAASALRRPTKALAPA